MYLKLTNGQPEIYSIGQLRRDNPDTSFPKQPTDALLAEWDVYPLATPPAPPTSEWEYPVRNELPHQNEQGEWVLGWTIEIVPQSEAEAKVREKRNQLLRETDWMALSDNTLTQPWADYRQALRDVPSQTGFPYEVVWPTKPV